MNFIVYSCYLPPENSARGRDAQSFFSHLLTQIYSNYESDYIFVGADLNARIGNLSDNIDFCDLISPREPLDLNVNQHGRDFIDFLIDSKFVVLNGRFNSINLDNYTSISSKGRAVVDYWFVPQDILTKCTNFRVTTMQEICDQNLLYRLHGERSRLPDHSAIFMEFDCHGYVHSSLSDPLSTNAHERRFKLRKIPSLRFYG
jgi:hypothetical protein